MIDENHIHPAARKIESILQEQGVWYERFLHEPVRTSEEAASVRPEYMLSQGTKSLIVRGKLSGKGKQFFMLVVPGDKQFNKKMLRSETGYDDVRFANEEEVNLITAGILPGGVPPWGNLFGLSIFADRAIFVNEKIVFNAGDRRVSIAMKAGDYLRLVKPIVVDIV